MNRLDDELKIAFRRREPSLDFTARVLARIDEESVPQPQMTLWQRLAAAFHMPPLGWAALATAALLLIVIGFAQFRAHRGVPGDDPRTATAGEPGKDTTVGAPEKTAPEPAATATVQSPEETTPNAPSVGARPERGRGMRREAHRQIAVADPKPSAEAEAARDKVMLALQITSETLNDAQRAISDDRTKDRPEPVPNR